MKSELLSDHGRRLSSQIMKDLLIGPGHVHLDICMLDALAWAVVVRGADSHSHSLLPINNKGLSIKDVSDFWEGRQG